MALQILDGFEVGGTGAIDSRFVKTKQQMHDMSDNLMPSDYFCMCSDDHKFYLYNKLNTVDATTGKYRVFEGGSGDSNVVIVGLPDVDDASALLEFFNSVVNYIEGGKAVLLRFRDGVRYSGYALLSAIIKDFDTGQYNSICFAQFTGYQSITHNFDFEDGTVSYYTSEQYYPKYDILIYPQEQGYSSWYTNLIEIIDNNYIPIIDESADTQWIYSNRDENGVVTFYRVDGDKINFLKCAEDGFTNSEYSLSSSSSNSVEVLPYPQDSEERIALCEQMADLLAAGKFVLLRESYEDDPYVCNWYYTEPIYDDNDEEIIGYQFITINNKYTRIQKIYSNGDNVETDVPEKQELAFISMLPEEDWENETKRHEFYNSIESVLENHGYPIIYKTVTTGSDAFTQYFTCGGGVKTTEEDKGYFFTSFNGPYQISYEIYYNYITSFQGGVLTETEINFDKTDIATVYNNIRNAIINVSIPKLVDNTGDYDITWHYVGWDKSTDDFNFNFIRFEGSEFKVLRIYPSSYEEQSQSSGGGALTSPITTNVDVGGIKAGTTIPSGTTFESLFNKVFVEYQKPTISLSITPSTTLYEKGTIISTLTLSASATKKSEDIANIKFYQGSTLLETITDDVSSGGNFTCETAITAFDTDTTFKASVTDSTTGSTVESSKTIKFVVPFYYGNSDTSTVSDLADFTKDVSEKGTKTYSYTASNKYLCILYPSSYGNLTSIKDSNNFENIGEFTSSTVTIDSEEYKLYISNEPKTVSAFSLTFKF